MEDTRIISLLIKRHEEGLEALKDKYGLHLRWMAGNILKDHQDVEECENDTYLRTWQTIPPVRPLSLKAYVSKIMRNLALDRYRYRHAKNRSGPLDALHSELIESIPDNKGTDPSEDGEIVFVIQGFLDTLDPLDRWIFLRRYFYGASVSSLAENLEISASALSTKLSRLRKKLRNVLEKEGIHV